MPFQVLLILVAGVGLFVFGAGIFPFKLDLAFLDTAYTVWQRAIMVAVALILCLLGIHGFLMLFRSSREHGFIMQHTEYGDLSISMTAMENMVKKCVDTHDELKVSSTRILHARDGVVVSMRISLASGVNIPLAVSALQKQIKQYITSCSGVDGQGSTRDGGDEQQPRAVHRQRLAGGHDGGRERGIARGRCGQQPSGGGAERDSDRIAACGNA